MSTNTCPNGLLKNGHPYDKYVPAAFRPKGQLRKSPPSDLVKHYGPERSCKSRKERDRKFWSKLAPNVAAEEEEKEKGKKEKEEKQRIPQNEVENIKALTVKDFDLHIRANAIAHHTNKFAITDKKKTKNQQAVLRRGQEFKVTVTFNRAYNKDKDDLIFIFDADEDTEGKKLKAKFKLTEDGTSPYKKKDEWGATVVEEEGGKQKLELSVYIPGDAVVGEWDVKVKTKLEGEKSNCVYTHSDPIIVLFNPWSEADKVHFTEDKKYLDEYILNGSGTVYRGNKYSIGSKSWTYGQFSEGVLHTCLSILRKAFDYRMSPCMGDPIMVSRALSRVVNSCDDNGVLVGNWSGNYDGGKSPSSWTSSRNILQQYEKDGEPVKYGQCWVFSHVLTAVCRALGLPCRSVTNFDSAHDTDNTCTIDNYHHETGEEVPGMAGDSIWNFHVWNEVWILRPDYPDVDYNGWHVIDATPQEQSLGMYQCGPCPVKAVKRGDINVPYDTAFVFGEVNADVVNWVVGPDGEVLKPSYIRQRNVGHMISTKCPDGKPHSENLNRDNWSKPDLRLDLTDTYKFPEGSEEERESVRRATGFLRHGSKLESDYTDLEVRFDTETQTMIGEDLVLTAYVKNLDKQDKEVDTVMAVRTCPYWDRSSDTRHLVKENFPTRRIKAGCEESFTVTVKGAEALSYCDESLSLHGYVCAKDLQTEMPYSNQRPIRLRHPDLKIAAPPSVKSLEPATVEVSLHNNTPLTLTKCRFEMEGTVLVADDDTNNFDFERTLWFDFGTWRKNFEDVNPGDTLVIKIRLVGELMSDDDENTDTNELIFHCAEVKDGITGCVPFHMVK